MSESKPIGKKVRHWTTEQLPLIIIAAMVLLLVITYFASTMFITIKSGEAGVMYRRFGSGTETDYVYPERLHFVLPWNTMYVYSVRVQTLKHDLTVLTNKGLPITLKLAIRYHPEYEMLGVLHKKVGGDYVNRILLPQIESVLRKKIGTLDPEDVYTNKAGILTKILATAIEETMRNYVVVKDIIIRGIELPDKIKQAIEDKLVEQERLKRYQYTIRVEKEEASRKKIEATGIKDYQDIISATLTDKLILWQGVQATKDIAKSKNSKVVIIGSGDEGLPVILGNQ